MNNDTKSVVLTALRRPGDIEELIETTRKICPASPVVLAGWAELGAVLLVERGGTLDPVASAICAGWWPTQGRVATEPPLVLSGTEDGIALFGLLVPVGSPVLMIAGDEEESRPPATNRRRLRRRRGQVR